MLSLDGGDWQVRGCLGREWEWHVSPDTDRPGWLPSRVPGSVLDLGRNRYVMTRTADLAPLLDLPAARVEVEYHDAIVRLRNTGVIAALGLVIEGPPRLDDNVVDLLPGETRSIGVTWPTDEVLVEGWNVEAIRCSP